MFHRSAATRSAQHRRHPARARSRKLLRERDLSSSVTDEAKDLLGERGYDPAYGARPLKRALQRYVAGSAGQGILAGDFNPGDTAVLRAKAA